MRRVRYSKGGYSINKRRKIFMMFAIILIIVGMVFTTSNIINFINGYYVNRTAFKQSQVLDIAKTDTAQSDNSNTLKDKLIMNDEIEKVLYPERPETGDEVGELYIPKLDKTLPIYEGTKDEELDKGVGHYAGSVLPGESDNSVLSGHRDTVFRKLGEIGKGDLLVVKTEAGEFEYKVSKVRIVDKDDRTVIVPKPSATLTVSTCYPFSYVGSAPKRYVLIAYLYSEKLK